MFSIGVAVNCLPSCQFSEPRQSRSGDQAGSRVLTSCLLSGFCRLSQAVALLGLECREVLKSDT